MDERNSPDASRPSLREQFASDPWPVVGFTTTEHNNLTSRRGTLTSETTGRVAAYLSTLSAGLVALGFVGGGSGRQFGDAFFAFGAVALALTALVGIVTFSVAYKGRWRMWSSGSGSSGSGAPISSSFPAWSTTSRHRWTPATARREDPAA